MWLDTHRFSNFVRFAIWRPASLHTVPASQAMPTSYLSNYLFTSPSASLLSSTTSSGRSGQLCFQHTIMLHSSGVVHMSQEVAALVFKFNHCLLPSLFFHQPHRFAIWAS